MPTEVKVYHINEDYNLTLCGIKLNSHGFTLNHAEDDMPSLDAGWVYEDTMPIFCETCLGIYHLKNIK